MEWGGKGDRVLLGGTVVTAAGRTKLFDSATTLSRPTGTAVLSISRIGVLLKREVDAPAERNLGILTKHTDVVYHPAGAQHRGGGRVQERQPELLITDNEGRVPRPLLEIEEAKSVSNPVFTASGALLYTADHGDRVDLHRLEIGSDMFSTPWTSSPPAGDHRPRGGVALRRRRGGVVEGECGSAVLRAQRGGAFFKTRGHRDRQRQAGYICVRHGLKQYSQGSSRIRKPLLRRAQLGFDVAEGRLTTNFPVVRTFDLVFSNNVLQHITDPVGFIRHKRACSHQTGSWY